MPRIAEIPVTDPHLDAPDGATLLLPTLMGAAAFTRSGDTWTPEVDGGGRPLPLGATCTVCGGPAFAKTRWSTGEYVWPLVWLHLRDEDWHGNAHNVEPTDPHLTRSWPDRERIEVTL